MGKGDVYEYNMTYPNNLSVLAKLGYIQPRMKEFVSNKILMMYNQSKVATSLKRYQKEVL
jgi:hypothetical protein